MTVSGVEIEIAGQRVSRGERRHVWLSLGHRPDGTPLGIPLIVITGMHAGPRLGITAGIHGDEYEGPEGMRRFLAGVEPAALRGAIIATPQANPLAFEVHSRAGGVDHLDLNRSFPGKREGFVTERIADLLSRQVVQQVDFLVDLHSAGLAYHLVPYVGFTSTPGAVGEASFALAKALGIEFVYGSTPFPNVIRLEAARRSVPACLVEVGGEGRLNLDLVSVVEQGLRNVARHIGLLEGDPGGLPTTYRILKAPPAGEFIHAPSGGFLLNRVSLGEEVRAGQLLAVLMDPFGTELARLEAPVGGRVIIQRTVPAVRTGDWAYAILQEVAQAGRETPLSAIAALQEGVAP